MKRAYYLDWVQKTSITLTRKRAAKLVTSTFPIWASPALNEFTKLYFPQIRKHALIVDVSRQRGGFVSPLVIERFAAG